MAVICRSPRSTEPAEIQVCGWPLRTSLSMPSSAIQACVTGRPTITASPTAKPVALFNRKLRAPAAT